MKSETRSAEGQMDSSSSSSSSCCDGVFVFSWLGVGVERVSRVNVMVLDGLTQSHFYRYFSHFRHLRNKYSTRWTLAPSSGDLLTSDLLEGEVAVCDGAAETRAPLPAALMWHPVIRRFNMNADRLSTYLLTEQEMIKQKFPVKGGQGCEGFVCTRSDGHMMDGSHLFGLDCEMCLTCAGFSGVTREMLAPVSTRLSDVQSKLLQLLPPDAVLVGHSLDGDLRALHMIHPHVIDTSVLYRQDSGRRFKLKHLAQVILKREIQSEVRTGHDPCEDALAALHLAQYFIRKGPKKVVEDHLEDLWDMDLPEEDDCDHVTSSDHCRSPLHFGHTLNRSGQSAVFLGGSVKTNGSLFSGVTREMLAPVSTRLSDVQSKLLQLLPPDAVLVGHSLDGDLRALHMIHPHVIDTSVLYRQDSGRRFKLKHLAQVILKREIQSEVRTGHDPCEDALAALHLAQYFIRKGPKKVVEDHLEDLWDMDLPEEDDCDHVTSSDHCRRYSSVDLMRLPLTILLSDGLSVHSQSSPLRPHPQQIWPISSVPGRIGEDERLAVQSAVPETAVLQ
ncbi:RNA exonuclease NEF-sp [Labeo rohita]|uniref:RNA exonuclease NEF-sp n=1 Tax=Labeo rohita TaxID=84645 RepID=A0A498NVD8_LABRO|nr:RNA exonuclease NEF-sp [Labeo rohita]